MAFLHHPPLILNTSNSYFETTPNQSSKSALFQKLEKQTKHPLPAINPCTPLGDIVQVEQTKKLDFGMRSPVAGARSNNPS